MGLNEPDEEDIAGSGGVCQWTTVNQDRDQCKDLVGQSHLLLVTVEYTSEENVSEKSQKFAKDSSNLVPNISLLGQQLNLLQSCSNDQYSILHYSNSYENNRDSNDAEGDIDEAAMSETQLLLFKNEIDVQSKNSIILPKSNNPESLVPNNVLITPLPETVVNTDLTNEIVKDSSSMVPSSSEMVRQEVNLSETDYSPGLNNVETHGNNEWDSDSSSEDEVRQVIVDKPVTCRAVASLPANFLSIDKIDGSLGDTFVGVFTTKEIPKRTQFGPVEGVLLSDEKSSVVLTASPFLELLIEQECGKMSRMDVSNEHLSNWMRYVRPAKNVEEQNLIISQHGKSLYYTTTRLIRAKEELKVWYSITYASTRGLPLLFSDSKRNVDTIGTLGVYEDYKNGNHQCQNQKTLKKVNSDLDNNNLVPKYNLRNYQDIYKLNQSKTKLFSLRKERNWRCSYCQRCFSNPTLLNLHTLTHAADTDSSDQIDIHCSRCSQDDKDKIEQENKPLNCSVCSKRFYTNSALICHVKTHKDDRKFECPICNQVFDKVLGLKAHVHSHSTNGYYSCSHCSKKYVEYKLIRKHIRTFHCGKNHKCINCSKKFPTLDKLRIHELSHSEHRQFLCANCGKQFKRKDKLSEHMRKIHYPDKEKISTTPRQKHPKNFVPKVLGNVSGYTQFVYKCHICIVGFKRRGMLVNHLANRHPDISPDSVPELNLPILKATKDYYCQYCDKIYKSSSKRKAHILKNHPGAKLPLSNKQMSTVSSLPGQENGTYSQTVGSVTTNPQGCQWCHKQYASKAKLLQHQRNKHSHLLPKSLQKPKKSIPADCGVQMISERCDGEKATEGSLILQGSLSNDTSEFGIKENDNPCFTEGEFIIDAPTLKKALRDEVITAECLPESIVELGQLIADSRPDQFFKVIQTPSGITYAQPIEIWDPLSSCQSLSPSDLDTSPFLTPYTGR